MGLQMMDHLRKKEDQVGGMNPPRLKGDQFDDMKNFPEKGK